MLNKYIPKNNKNNTNKVIVIVLLYLTLMDKNKSGSYVPGAIGCALSHLKIYKHVVDNNIPYALILEDDVNYH